MWLKPRETIQSIVDHNPKQSVLLLASLFGISKVLDKASFNNAADTTSLSGIFAIAIVGGSIYGIVSLYIGSFLIKHTGHWLGGKSNSENVRAAIAWSSVPVAWALLLWIPELAIFGKDLFTSTTPTMVAHPYLAKSLLAIELAIDITITIWTLVLLFRSLGQVHGFSAWKALGACLVAAPLFVVPILGFVLLVALLPGELFGVLVVCSVLGWATYLVKEPLRRRGVRLSRVLLFAYFLVLAAICISVPFRDILARVQHQNVAGSVPQVLTKDSGLLVLALCFAMGSLSAWRGRRSQEVFGRGWLLAASVLSLVLTLGFPMLFFLQKGAGGFWRAQCIFAVPTLIGVFGLYSQVRRARKFPLRCIPDGNIRTE